MVKKVKGKTISQIQISKKDRNLLKNYTKTRTVTSAVDALISEIRRNKMIYQANQIIYEKIFDLLKEKDYNKDS
jgi:hypothetical protein